MTGWAAAQQRLLEEASHHTQDADHHLAFMGATITPAIRDDGIHGVRLVRADTATTIEVYPASDGSWDLQAWVPAVAADHDTVLLALEVLTATSEPTHKWTETPDWGPYNFHTEYSTICNDDVEFAAAVEELVTHMAIAAVDVRKKTTAEYLSNRIPGLVLKNFGGILPIQAEGTWHGYPFYFRFRHSPATLNVGIDDAIGDPYWSSYTEVPDEWYGSMNDYQFISTFLTLARQLTPVPPEVRFPEVSPTSDAAITGWYGRGNTIEDAYADAVARCATVYSGQVDPPSIDPTPIEPFTPRIWPNVNFAVLPES